MATENEQPIQVPSVPVCAICEKSITDNEMKLICTNEQCGKLLCVLCIKKTIQSMFGQPALNYPLKCSICSHIFDQTILLEFMSMHDQYEKFIACIFPLYWAKDCLNENETLAQCKCEK